MNANGHIFVTGQKYKFSWESNKIKNDILKQEPQHVIVKKITDHYITFTFVASPNVTTKRKIYFHSLTDDEIVLSNGFYVNSKDIIME